jgi:hypothetical protein
MVKKVIKICFKGSNKIRIILVSTQCKYLWNFGQKMTIYSKILSLKMELLFRGLSLDYMSLLTHFIRLRRSFFVMKAYYCIIQNEVCGVSQKYWFKAYSNSHEAWTRLGNIPANRNSGFESSVLLQPFAVACQYSGSRHQSSRTLSNLFTLLKKMSTDPSGCAV